jgi:HAD superfamily hydrolase (TIGR01509 family)
MIKTIIFDLSEVYLKGLFGFHKEISKKLGKLVNESDLHISELEELFHGKIKEEDYWKAAILKNGWNLKIDWLKNMIRKYFKEIRGTRRIIESLKKNGYKLGLLSVHAKEWIKYCEKKYKYRKLFNSILYSFEVASCKPEKKVYELMLRKLKSKSEECVFIDDHHENLETASKLGMQVIKFESAGRLKKDLKKLGIKVV